MSALSREVRNDVQLMEKLAELLAASYHSWQGDDEEKSLRFADEVEAEVTARFRAIGGTPDEARVFIDGLFFGVMTMTNVDTTQDVSHRAR